MSRRATPQQAAQNQQAIKGLLKLEPNKFCADCKRNKHPRWASWNLGVFICIRCSGVHRGMGTHISRVKSVDLDSWTDEQLQSIMRWGNSRANKYWESKLAPGHAPSEAKIENFIRTKYESKRWVMDGPMPDPRTLDDGDDDVPLAVVQEKAKLQRSTSHRVTSSNQPSLAQRPRHQHPQSVDLISGVDIGSPPARPNTTQPNMKPPPKEPAAPPKSSRPGESLIGLDFFGSSEPASINRPSSTSSTLSNSTGMSRPDLKQSILSLYSKPSPSPAPVKPERTPSFGELASPTTHTPTTQPSSSSNLGGLTDAFSGLSFPPPKPASPPQKPAEKPSPFANLASFTNPKSTPAAPQVTSRNSSVSGGNLFESLASPSNPPSQPQQRTSSFNSFDINNSKPAPAKPASPPPSSLSFDPFGLGTTPAPPSKPTPQPASQTSPEQDLRSAFNLSKPEPKPEPSLVPTTDVTKTTATATSLLSSTIDPWGDNAWTTPDPAPSEPPVTSTASMMKVPDTLTANDIGTGWGAASSSKPEPTVTSDEDFGGWASAVPSSSPVATTKPVGGFAGADDLFSNVWE